METGQTVTLNLKLEIGHEATAVTVTESSLHLETTDTALGDTIVATKISSVPLNGRSFTDMLALQAGVVPISSRQANAVVMSGCTSTPPSGDLNPGNLSINGQRETSNGFVLNGSIVEEDFNMGAALIPNLDSIEDFRVLTGNFDAQYGNYSGGQVVVSTKSGTNDLHGSGFEFLRNTDLDARNPFDSPDRAKYDQNQFGGTLGGALKRDQTFFFADYQGTRINQGVETGLISVPSLDERAGDLTGIAGLLKGNVNGESWADRLSQSLGYPVSAGEPYYFSGCENRGQCVLPSANIPLSAWSGPAKTLIGAIPLPNQRANGFSTSAFDESLRDDKAAARIDAHKGRESATAYYFFDGYALNNPYPTAQGGASVPGFNAITLGRSQLASLGLTTILSGDTVNEFHLGYLRDANNVGRPQGGVGPALRPRGSLIARGIRPFTPWRRRLRALKMSRSTTSPSAWTPQDSWKPTTLFSCLTTSRRSWGRTPLKQGRDSISTRSISTPMPPSTARSPSRARRRAPILPTFSWGRPAATRKGTPWLSIFAIGTSDFTHRTVGACGRI